MVEIEVVIVDVVAVTCKCVAEVVVTLEAALTALLKEADSAHLKEADSVETSVADLLEVEVTSEEVLIVVAIVEDFLQTTWIAVAVDTVGAHRSSTTTRKNE